MLFKVCYNTARKAMHKSAFLCKDNELVIMNYYEIILINVMGTDYMQLLIEYWRRLTKDEC